MCRPYEWEESSEAGGWGHPPLRDGGIFRFCRRGRRPRRPAKGPLRFQSPPSSASHALGTFPKGEGLGGAGGAPLREFRKRRAEVVAPYTKKRSIIAPSSAPVCALGHLPPRGKACRRLIAAPTANQHQCRWFGKPRRRCGTAPAAIFANPGPGGPAGIQTLTQISARRKFFAWFKG